MYEYPGEAMVRNASEHAFSNRCAEYRFDRRSTANAGSTAWSSSRSMANSLPTTMAQSGPIRFAHCSHRFLSHCRHTPLPGRSVSFVDHRSAAVAGRSRCVQSPVFPCQTSSE